MFIYLHFLFHFFINLLGVVGACFDRKNIHIHLAMRCNLHSESPKLSEWEKTALFTKCFACMFYGGHKNHTANTSVSNV